MFIFLRDSGTTELCACGWKYGANIAGKFLGRGVVLTSLILAGFGAGFASPASAQQNLVSTPALAELPDAPSAGLASDDARQKSVAPPAAPGTSVVSGTVLDTNNDVIQGARVVLSNRAGEQHEVQSGANGQFQFSGLPPGSYKLTVTGNGMGNYASPWINLHSGESRILSGVVLPVAAASTSITVEGNHVEINQELADQQVQIAEDQRVWGVFPNFYSSYEWNAPPLGPKQKFRLAFRSMMDPMAFAGAAGIAGAEQFYNVFPAYGGGVPGYFKRFGAAYTNDFSSRMLSSGLFASVFHQDPRYFYKGTGSFQSRAMYAVSSAVVTRGDNGRLQPNYSHVLGVFAAAALSNLYYPKESRGLGLTLINGAVETAGNAGSNLVREFILKGITSHPGGKP